jgi:hypothetical protein
VKLIEQLVGHFGLECIQDSIDENNSQFVSHYSVADPKLPQAARLKKSLALFPSRDTIILEWALEGFDGAILSNRSDESLDLFILTIETQLSLDDQPHNCHLSLRVEKSREAGALSVYSLPKLADFWARDGLPNAFRRFSDLRQSRVALRVWGLSVPVRTECFIFEPFEAENDIQLEDSHVQARRDSRQEKLEKRDRVSHFANASDFEFIPEDFDLSGKLFSSQAQRLFTDLRTVASLVFLSDYSRFCSTDTIHIRLNGYRLFTADIRSIPDSELSSGEEYYAIYRWAYDEGNIVDKIGLCRNVISLHIDDDNLLRIKPGTIQSIGSGYQIYLKDNVKQYIELKNKLSEFIEESSEKASGIARSAAGYYKGSIWTMYSFFGSVFVLRALGTKSGAPLVSDDLYVVFLAFVSVAVLMMRYALAEMTEERARFVERYAALKERYKDLLIPADLERILAEDKQHSTDLKYIDTRRRSLGRLWDLSLSAVFVAMTALWLFGKM